MFALAIPIIELLILLVGIGMAALSRPQAGGFVNWLAKSIEQAPIIGGLVSIEWIVKLDQWLTHEIGRATGTVTRRGTAWFAALNHYQDVVGYWSLYWPVGLYHTTRHLVERVMPHAITARTAPLSTRLDATEAQAKALAGELHSFPKVSKAQDKAQARAKPQTLPMPWASDWDWLHGNIDALKKVVAGAAAAAVAGTLPHAPAWPHPWRGIRTELGKLWKFRNYVLGATGAAAIVATAIGGVTASCVRKGNIGKTARRLCGLDNLIMDALLADLAFTAGTISIVEFAKALQKAAPLTATSMVYLVDEIPMSVAEAEAIGKRALKVLESVA